MSVLLYIVCILSISLYSCKVEGIKLLEITAAQASKLLKSFLKSFFFICNARVDVYTQK